jgi:hypothetical protein
MVAGACEAVASKHQPGAKKMVDSVLANKE